MLPRDLHTALLNRLVAGDLAAVNARLATLRGEPPILVERVANVRTAAAVPVWRLDASGQQRFRFHPEAWGADSLTIFSRWLAMWPMFQAVSAMCPCGWVSFNLGDEPHRPGLAFSAADAACTLVPDPMFLETDGYAALAAVLAQGPPWYARVPVLFWRGSTTGSTANPEDLPRIRLCRWAASTRVPTDIGLSSVLPQYAAAGLAGLEQPFVPPERLADYALHLDIDGYSNSWPGLFTKLLSGSPVLKVASANGYRQWYYPRLRAWENFVPVRADLTDLADTVSRLLADPARATAIGQAGQALARSLQPPLEIARVLPAVVAAFRPA